jgi:predicted DNA binding CopG/RHH family protein
MKALQKFSAEYLEQCRAMKPEQIVRFLEDFRTLQADAAPIRSRLISLKVREDLLEAFKTEAKLHRIPYQTLIKQLMTQWLKGLRSS